MAQLCPHEQPEETTQEPMTDTAAYRYSTPASYPQVGEKECMPTHDGNGQGSSDNLNTCNSESL